MFGKFSLPGAGGTVGGGGEEGGKIDGPDGPDGLVAPDGPVGPDPTKLGLIIDFKINPIGF